MKFRASLFVMLTLSLGIAAISLMSLRGCEVPDLVNDSFRVLHVSIDADLVDENDLPLDDVGISVYESTTNLITFTDSTSKRFVWASKNVSVKGSGYAYMQLVFDSKGRKGVVVNVKKSGKYHIVVKLRPTTQQTAYYDIIDF